MNTTKEIGREKQILDSVNEIGEPTKTWMLMVIAELGGAPHHTLIKNSHVTEMLSRCPDRGSFTKQAELFVLCVHGEKPPDNPLVIQKRAEASKACTELEKVIYG